MTELSTSQSTVKAALVPTMAQIVRMLARTYTEDGVAIWLSNRNKDLGGFKPIDLCVSDDGRVRVFSHAYDLAGA